VKADCELPRIRVADLGEGGKISELKATRPAIGSIAKVPYRCGGAVYVASEERGTNFVEKVEIYAEKKIWRRVTLRELSS